MRKLVWLICTGMMIALGIAVYLNLQGVPKPILRKVVHRITESGILVDIESIHLSLQGWRATNVRCYSGNPDDLEPVLMAREVFFRRNGMVDYNNQRISGYDITANGIVLSPSVDWCIGLPKDSALRQVEHISLAIAFGSRSVVVKDGQIKWHDLMFNVNGTMLKKDVVDDDRGKPVLGKEFQAFIIDQELLQDFEEVLAALRLSEKAVVDIDFLFNAGRPASSRLTISAQTKAFEYRDVFFSLAEIAVSYEFPRFQLDRAALHKDNGVFSIKGEYDLDTKETLVQVSNSLSSKQLFLLLPQSILSFLAQQEIRTDSFPLFDLQFGPTQPQYLHRKLTGSFALKNIMLRDLEFSSLSGKLSRTGDRLDVFELRGEVDGQEHRSDEVGSSMAGGSAAGEVFWDAASSEIGIIVESSIDPNLLVGPLAFSDTATNVISRFRFDGQAPLLRTELGACYDNWRSLYISIQGSASDLYFHDVPFTSLNASTYYSKGLLSIDRLVAKQGVDFVKGSVSLDFRNGVAGFDAVGSINPETIEGVVYPRNGIFGRSVKVSGVSKISGRGTVDWRHMRKTDFLAEVEAQRMELPMAVLNQFSAKVTGDGPVIQVEEAVFNVFGGEGDGTFSLLADPSGTGVPYKVDVRLRNMDIKEYLEYLHPDTPHDATGELSGYLQAEADFSRGFFDSANGNGRVHIRHGQLADLPLFRGFSSIMRMVIPSFKMFSINRLKGDFELKDGVIYSKNAYFDGDLLSAKGRGSYSTSRGFNAYVQAQVFSDNDVSRIFRFFTDPLLKLFEVKLEGTFKEPQWKLNTFSLGEKDRAGKE